MRQWAMCYFKGNRQASRLHRFIGLCSRGASAYVLHDIWQQTLQNGVGNTRCVYATAHEHRHTVCPLLLRGAERKVGEQQFRHLFLWLTALLPLAISRLRMLWWCHCCRCWTHSYIQVRNFLLRTRKKVWNLSHTHPHEFEYSCCSEWRDPRSNFIARSVYSDVVGADIWQWVSIQRFLLGMEKTNANGIVKYAEQWFFIFFSSGRSWARDIVITSGASLR